MTQKHSTAARQTTMYDCWILQPNIIWYSLLIVITGMSIFRTERGMTVNSSLIVGTASLNCGLKLRLHCSTVCAFSIQTRSMEPCFVNILIVGNHGNFFNNTRGERKSRTDVFLTLLHNMQRRLSCRFFTSLYLYSSTWYASALCLMTIAFSTWLLPRHSKGARIIATPCRIVATFSRINDFPFAVGWMTKRYESSSDTLRLVASNWKSTGQNDTIYVQHGCFNNLEEIDGYVTQDDEIIGVAA